MSAHVYRRFDPLLPAEDADALLRLCERFGRYGMYSEESTSEGFGEGITQRHDAVLNFLKTGGRLGRREDPAVLAARTNYFRETYAYAAPVVPGIEPFLHCEGFVEAARELHGRPIVRPAIVYANLLVPGQELSVHTDVPEFRGASRMNTPQWLLVAAHHSGLFERWRMPIATAVAWFGNPDGGEFVFYPDGPQGAPVVLPAKHDTAVLLDTDSVFHGVDRVRARNAEVAPLRPGMQLRYAGEGTWRVTDGETEVARYGWSELRFSISWKAYCFADEQERRSVSEHADDLSRDRILATLTAYLRERGRIQGAPSDRDLALAIIDEYIHYPPPAGEPAQA